MTAQTRRFLDRIFCSPPARGYGCISAQRKDPPDWTYPPSRWFRSGAWTGRCPCPDCFRSILSHYYRLHDPCQLFILGSLEFLLESWVLRGQSISHGNEVVGVRFFLFALLLKRFFILFYVFGHKILPAELIVVPEVINFLSRKQPDLVESMADQMFFAPINIPVIVLCPFVASFKQSLADAVIEICFKLNIWSESINWYGSLLNCSLGMYLWNSSDIYIYIA